MPGVDELKELPEGMCIPFFLRKVEAHEGNKRKHVINVHRRQVTEMGGCSVDVSNVGSSMQRQGCGACCVVGGGVRVGVALVDVRLDVVPLPTRSSSQTVAGCRLCWDPVGRDRWGGELVVGVLPRINIDVNVWVESSIMTGVYECWCSSALHIGWGLCDSLRLVLVCGGRTWSQRRLCSSVGFAVVCEQKAVRRPGTGEVGSCLMARVCCHSVQNTAGAGQAVSKGGRRDVMRGDPIEQEVR